MHLALKLHPDSTCKAVERIEVEVVRAEPDKLALRYIATGRIDDVVIPMLKASVRTNELWMHTCFEAFLKAPRRKTYCEINLAPSTQWAAYRFRDYRKGMRPIDEVAPTVDVKSSRAFFELRALLDLSDVPELPPKQPWRLGLSAVIEERGGNKSYWALAHPKGKADFHHAGGFAAELPVARRP